MPARYGRRLKKSEPQTTGRRSAFPFVATVAACCEDFCAFSFLALRDCLVGRA